MGLIEDLAWIRDWVGAAPDDDTVREHLRREQGGLAARERAALRILRRRRADMAAGGGAVTGLTVPGVISVTQAAGDARALDEAIARLEVLVARLDPDSAAGGVRWLRRTDVAR